jgi:hypothetical protein
VLQLLDIDALEVALERAGEEPVLALEGFDPDL